MFRECMRENFGPSSGTYKVGFFCLRRKTDKGREYVVCLPCIQQSGAGTGRQEEARRDYFFDDILI